MLEKFNVVRVRFHIKDKQILVIQGWKYEMEPEEEFTVTLDGELLPWEMKVYNGMEVRQRYMVYDLGIEEEYFLYVKLPEDFTSKRELMLCAGEKAVYREKTAKLKRQQGQIDVFLEEVALKKGQCYIKGWAVSESLITVRAKSTGGEVFCDISWHERRDVLHSYREAVKVPDAGFEIRLPHRGLSAVRLDFCDGDCRTYVKVPIVATYFFENMLGSSYLGKGMRFLQRHGIRKFASRTVEVMKQKANPQGDYGKYRLAVMPTPQELNRQRGETWKEKPLFSIVVPLYKTPVKYLEQLVKSVRAQTYDNWELCLSDGSGEPSPLANYLGRLAQKDQKIKIVSHEKPLRISENTNAAIGIARGDFLVFADHDDLLTEDALYECAKVLERQPDTDLIYSDEDKVSMNGRRYFEPHFKSDYNPDLLCSMNYFCHLVVVRRSLTEQTGLLREEFDGAQDYDFVLRCVEHTDRIVHIPRVLYHWRAHENSTAENPQSKMYAFEAGLRAIEAHYERRKLPAQVEFGEYPGLYKTVWKWKEQPLVSILIPNKDHIQDLDKCIQSIEQKSEYRNYEYIIIENNSENEETFAYYKKLEAENEKAHVVYWDGAFNFSAINNFGAEHAKGEYLLLLNNDTEIIHPDCLWQLLGYCMREDVGAVGARLYYEDGSIQHAGVVLGFGGIAGHTFIGFPHDANGYFSRIICAQDYSAVTAACMMTKKSVYEQVGGLTEELVVAFNDIDYCMKVRALGKLVVYNPYAQLYHYESKSRGLEDSPEKQERYYREMKYFVTKWKECLDSGDPYYNPNLTLAKADFSLRQV